MLGVLVLDSNLESSPGQDLSLKAGLGQGSKLMDLVNDDTEEQSSSETREEEHDTELKRQPLKVLLSLPLPSGQEEVGLELQEEEEQWEPQQEAKQKLELEEELEWELEEVENQRLHVVNKADAVPPLHPTESPLNQTAAQDSAMPTAMVFSEAALPE